MPTFHSNRFGYAQFCFQVVAHFSRFSATPIFGYAHSAKPTLMFSATPTFLLKLIFGYALFGYAHFSFEVIFGYAFCSAMPTFPLKSFSAMPFFGYARNCVL